MTIGLHAVYTMNGYSLEISIASIAPDTRSFCRSLNAREYRVKGRFRHARRTRRVNIMPDKRYSKVEEEIIQILDQMDNDPPAAPPANLVPFRPRAKPSARRLDTRMLTQARSNPIARVKQYSSGSWVGVGIVAALIAWQLSRFSGTLALVAMTLSVIAFLFALYTRRSAGVVGGAPAAPTTKRWRGRDIDFDQTRRTSIAERTRNWGRKKRGPRR